MPSDLVSKLQLRSGQKLTVLNVPEGYSDRLASELDGVELGDFAEPDAAIVFVTALSEATQRARTVFDRVKAGGVVWIVYPKGGSKVKTDVNRDKLWEQLKPTGWRPVRQVALDETWSAMRFRPEAEVGK